MKQNYVPASNWLTRGQHWTLLEVAEWLLLMHAVGLGAGYWYNKRTGDLQSVGMSCTRHVNSALANSSARRRDFTYCSLRLHATGTDCYCVTKHHASQCLWTAGTHTLTVHQLRPQPSRPTRHAASARRAPAPP